MITNRTKISSLIFLFLALILGKVDAVGQSYSHLADYELGGNGSFGLLKANEQYILFYEFFSAELYLIEMDEEFDPSKIENHIQKKKFERGRGPNELGGIISSISLQGHEVVLNDFTNNKLLVYDIIEDDITDIVHEQITPRIIIHEGKEQLILADYSKAEHPVYLLNLATKALSRFSNSFNNDYLERLRIFSMEGFFVEGDGGPYFFKRYLPEYYKIDVSNHQISERVEYAESQIGNPRSLAYGGDEGIGPPQVSVTCDDAAVLSSTELLLLLDGKKDYTPGILYKYLIEEDEITPFLEFKNEPMEFALTDKYIITLANFIRGGKNTLSIYAKNVDDN